MLDALLLLAAAFIIYIVYSLTQWEKTKKAYMDKRNIKYYSPTSFWGVFVSKFSADEFAQLIYQGFPDQPVVGMFNFRVPQFVLRDPNAIKQIAVKDFDHFEDHTAFIEQSTDKLWGNSLFLMTGEKWRAMRSTLSPAVTGSKMRQMFDLVAECADEVVNYFQTEAKNGKRINVEMKDFFSKYTCNVIGSCAFGLKINSFADEENEFYLNGKSLIDFTNIKILFRMLLMSKLPSIAKALNVSLTGGSVGDSFRNTIFDTMQIRKEKNIFRPDMINIMMQVRDGTLKHQTDEKKNDQEGFATVEESEVGKTSVNRKWNDDEIVAQCFLFFTAGFDTTSTLLTFASYELMTNQDVQKKLYEEIVEMNQQLDGKRINYDALQKMKYLDQVVSESLRKWPPATQVDRICVKDYIFHVNNEMTFKVEKGSSCLIPIYGIHNDPKYFPDPQKFDPERFSDDNKHNIEPNTYLPFGIGPRNCIGKINEKGSRFALMEIKAILYNLLLNFSFEPNEKTDIPVKMKKGAMVLVPENGMHLELKPRKK